MSSGAARQDVGASVLARLRAVQDLDRAVASLQRSIDDLPVEREGREGVLGESEDGLAAIEAAVLERQMEADAVELEIKQREARLEELKVRVNTVRDTAQMLAIQNEMRTLGKANGVAETRVLEAMEALESAGIEVAEAQSALEVQRTDHAEFVAAAEKDDAEWKVRMAVLADERAEAATALDGETLDHYERLFQAREGTALSECKGGQCQGCYTSLPQNVAVRLHQPELLTTCPTCSRILYLDED